MLPSISEDRTAIWQWWPMPTAELGKPGWLETVAAVLPCSVETVPGLVRQARQYGYLPPTTRGRGGGPLTLKGAGILGLVPGGTSEPQTENATKEDKSDD